MLQDRELEIQIQFLEEANDNLNTLESVLLELQSNHQISSQNINLALKATNYIKGGASVMGFPILSDFAQRLEDSLEIFKTRINSLVLDTELHNLLLSGVDWLRKIVELLSVGYVVDEEWLATLCYPVFEELQNHLGEPIFDDSMTNFSPADTLQNIIPLIFQTEVEDCLQRLESVLKNGDKSVIKPELTMIAAQFGGLGERLKLPTFTRLCESIMQHIDAAISDETVVEIAKLALPTWRRSQTLILTNQLDSLPTEISLKFDAAQVKYNNPEKPKNTEDFTEKNAISLEVLQKLFGSNHQRENQEITARVPANQIEKTQYSFKELSLQNNSLKMQIDRLHKLIRNLSLRVKKLERENHELRLAYDKFATKISVGNQIESEGENIYRFIHKNNSDNSQELSLLSQTVMEAILKIQEITSDIELSLTDTNQVNSFLNKTAQNLQNSFSQPLFTSSEVRVLLVESNRMLLAFPSDVVEEICLLDNEQISLIADSEIFHWQGSRVQLIRLERYLQFNCLHSTTSTLEIPAKIDAASVLIIKSDNQSLAVQIDRCWGEVKVANCQVEGNISLPTGFSNCAILNNGQVVPLVSASELLHWVSSALV